MKKFLKIIIIIAVVALLAFVGYKIYQKYSNKFEEMDADKGWGKYSEVANDSDNQTIFSIEYNDETTTKSKVNKEKGTITTDDMGYYHLWSGSTEGSQYIIKSDADYVTYGEANGAKTANRISSADFNDNYASINDVGTLGFLTIATIAEQEEYIINNFYAGASGITSKDGIVEVFGFIDNDTYLWRTTYKCTYVENGVTFTSTFKREVVFDTLVREVTIEKVDKELNSKGKVNKKGQKKTIDLSFKISYKTKQNIVKTDFSAYPAA